MKIYYPKLRNDSRKDKKSFKEKFEKFKRAFATWEESDVESSDQDIT